ncbi:hypothetical protein BsWGS_08432 [Bradybaena similaris]
MALPTMSGYWSSRKNMYEQAIVRHREHENEFRNQWSETANYFKKSEVWAAKQNAWSSSGVFQDSMDAYQASVEKDVKALNLKRRRDKLATLLAQENMVYEAELKSMSGSNIERLDEMRVRAAGLKSAREEKRQRVVEDKLYQHWMENNPDMRKAESQLLQEHVVANWGDQLVEKEERLETARLEKMALERQMEQERLAALELDRQKEEKRLQEEQSVKKILKEQMLEFRMREAEAEIWRQQQEDLLKHKWELEQIEDRQRRKEDERKKKELGRLLLRQHKAQMLHKSRVIQEELEQDRKLLESLIEKEQEEVALQTARKEKARADAQWMKQVIDDQLRLEKAREAELDMLYQDEAGRVWQKREAEWEKEREARQRLMAEVLESRQEQITEKLNELQRQQEESLQRREELVREMEIVQQMTQREEEEERRNKITTRSELEGQIRARRDQEQQLKEQLFLDLAKEKDEEEGYEDVMRQETQRLRLQGYTPRNHGRRQAWM